MNRKEAPRKVVMRKTRSAAARAAWDATGGGFHESRPNRQRSRAAALRAAIGEEWEVALGMDWDD